MYYSDYDNSLGLEYDLRLGVFNINIEKYKKYIIT